MAENTLLIEIEAKTAQAVSNINAFAKAMDVSFSGAGASIEDFEKKLKDLEKQLKTASGANLVKLTDQINTLKGGIANIKSGGFDKLAPSMDKLNKSTASAIPTLTNFGRVVQDAPFGLIGIANNIDPLVSSFTALKASTGTTGGALKALAGSLMGPAGIAIGVSAVTSLLIAFGDKLFGASKEATALNKALTDAAGTASKELVDFAALVGFAQDHTKSLSERKKAVDALQKEYPAYLKNVSDEAILTGKATEAINKSIDAILRQATIKLLKDEIAKSVEETAKQIIAIEKAVAVTKAKAAEDKNAAEAQKNLADATKDFNDQALRALQSGRGIREANKEIAQAADQATFAQANRPEDKIKRLKDELFKSIAPILQLAEGAGDLDANLDKAGKKAKVVKEEIEGAVQMSIPGAAMMTEWEVAMEKYRESLRKGKMELVDFIRILNQGPAVPKGIQTTNPFATDWIAQLKAGSGQAQKVIEEQTAIISSLIRESVRGSLVSLGEGLGNLMSGVADPFQALFQTLASAMRQFGEVLIAFATAKIGLDKLFKGPMGGPIALAAGIGLIALSTAVKNWTGPKFAEGGIVNGPTLAMVGDNPGRKEAIIPIEKWDMLNNGGGPIILDTRVSGSDILLVQRRAAAQFARTNG